MVVTFVTTFNLNRAKFIAFFSVRGPFSFAGP
jgi:hypothetical protein